MDSPNISEMDITPEFSIKGAMSSHSMDLASPRSSMPFEPLESPVSASSSPQSSIDKVLEPQHFSNLAVKRLYQTWLKLRQFYIILGPAWLVSCTFIDPGSLGSDLQQGAYTGYQLIWVTFWATALGYVFQRLAARLGVVQEKDMAKLCYERYGRKQSLVIWLWMELSIVGNDFQAVIGCIVALNLLFSIPYWAGCVITLFTTFFFTWLYYYRPQRLESICGGIMLSMTLMFIIDVGYTPAPAGEVIFSWVVPTAASGTILTILGAVGGLVTPNVMFLGSYLVTTKIKNRIGEGEVRSQSEKEENCTLHSYELAFAMFISFLGNLFIVIVFASSFYTATCAAQQLGYIDGECGQIILQDSAQALAQLYGNASQYIFAIGLFCSGQNSMISGTLAGQVTFEGFTTWKISFWQRLLLTRTFTLAPTIAITLLTVNNAVVFSFLNEWINILESIVLPFAMIPAVQLTSSKQVMGSFVTGPKLTLLNYMLILALVGVNLYLIIGFIFQPVIFGSVGGYPDTPWFYCLIGAFLVTYMYFLAVVSAASLPQITESVKNTYMEIGGLMVRLRQWHLNQDRAFPSAAIGNVANDASE